MKRTILFVTLLISLRANAQEVLTLDEVLANALSNNFDIQVSKYQAAIAENSATLGMAGLLPSVTANASKGAQINNTDLEFAGNLPATSVDGAQSGNTSANISANYVVFSGFSNRYQYQRLKLNSAVVDMQSRAVMEATLLQVASSYFVLARAIDQERIAEENVAISLNRYRRMAVANELGSSLRTELLAARVDLTSDSSLLLSATLQKNNAIRSLERLILQDIPDDVTCEPMEISLQDWTAEKLYEVALANNAQLKNAELQTELARKDNQILWASVFPTLSISGGYGYNNQQTEAGIVLNNTSTGLNGSIVLSYPLFTGFRNQTNRENQSMNIKIRELQEQSQELQLATDIQNALATYEQSVELLRFELKNLEAAQLNRERVEELFINGQASSTQFREAQVAYAAAQVRISNARISVKLNEIEINRLTGQILGKENG